MDIFIAQKKEDKEKKEQSQKIFAEEKKEKREFSSEEFFDFKNKEIGLFSSFHIRPIFVTFKGQEEDEEIVLFLRKHFVTNLYWILIGLLIAIIPTVFFIFRQYFPVPPLPVVYNLIAFLFYFTVVGAYFYINFITWYFNISLVTQRRLIDVHFIDIIYHDMAITRLNLIEDVSYTQAGFLKSLFNYGDIFVQTAGEKMHFDFLSVPEPEHVLNTIENLMGGDRNVK